MSTSEEHNLTPDTSPQAEDVDLSTDDVQEDPMQGELAVGVDEQDGAEEPVELSHDSVPSGAGGVSDAGDSGDATSDRQDIMQVQTYQPLRVRMSVARVEPWSVMKVSFLLSVALGIATVIAALLLWLLLNAMQVFGGIQAFVGSIDSTGTIAAMVDFLKLPKVLALTTVMAVANVALITALSTVGALLYNLAARLVGGLQVSFYDD